MLSRSHRESASCTVGEETVPSRRPLVHFEPGTVFWIYLIALIGLVSSSRFIEAATSDAPFLLSKAEVQSKVPVIISEEPNGVVAVNVHCSLLTTYYITMDGTRH